MREDSRTLDMRNGGRENGMNMIRSKPERRGKGEEGGAIKLRRYKKAIWKFCFMSLLKL